MGHTPYTRSLRAQGAAMAGRGNVHAFLLLVLCGAGAWAQSDSCSGFEENIGDGWCDMENNNEDCMYDGGDCCRCEVDTSQDDFAWHNFFSCRDPDSDCVDPLIADYPNCIRGDIGAIGDGFCDLKNNNEDCMYDGGDCCLCPTSDADSWSDDSSSISSSFSLCVDPDGACYDKDNIAIQLNCTNGYIQGIGDGFCNLENNNAGCDYDGGDCCDCGRNRLPHYGYSSDAVFSLCIDPDETCSRSASGTSQSNCTNGLNEGIGNGRCDEENNNEGCLYDGGDCCPCTCVPGMAYECGTNGYSCLSSVVFDREGDVCPDTITSCDEDVRREWFVEDTSGARQLAEALQCTGGLFNVEWSGIVVMDRTLSISNGTVLTVSGIDANATIVGDGNVGLFSVMGATLHLQNITLSNGSATYGGAISASRSRLTFSQVSFVGNSASDGGGGALYVSDGAVLSFVGTSTFANNTAPNGGALYAAYGSSAVWGGKTSFSFNAAIAGCHGNDVPYMRITATSTGSTTTSSCEEDAIASGYGGALYLTNSSSAVWTSPSHFVYNHADIDGGAVFVAQGSSMVWAAESHFLGNNARQDGGAVFMERSSAAWTATTKFSENSAGYDGGALYVTDGSSADWIALSSFFENTAESDGGAVFASTNGTLTWGKNALFDRNLATNGGAFFFSNGAKVVWGGETHFAFNRAKLDGGAIASRALDSELTTSEYGAVSVVNDDGSFLFVQDALSFTNNTCGANGGAMALVQSLTVTFETKNITFLNNTARISGGAIFLAGTGIGVVFENVTFVGNAAQTGGAVYATGSGTAVTVNQFDQQEENPTTFIGCHFANNFAHATGGGVDSSSGLDLFLHTTFVANEARVGGGLRLAGTASVRQCYFEENISELGGGPAVSSVGFLSNVNFSEFVDNVFDCDPGTFLDFEEIDEEVSSTLL